MNPKTPAHWCTSSMEGKESGENATRSERTATERDTPCPVEERPARLAAKPHVDRPTESAARGHDSHARKIPRISAVLKSDRAPQSSSPGDLRTDHRRPVDGQQDPGVPASARPTVRSPGRRVRPGEHRSLEPVFDPHPAPFSSGDDPTMKEAFALTPQMEESAFSRENYLPLLR
jgi:hypothetical protein